jgi:hypothetical protein
MNTPIKVALLTSLTTAALVYVILEWRPLRTEGSRGPEVSWAAPSTLPVEAVTAPAEPAPAGDSPSEDEQPLPVDDRVQVAQGSIEGSNVQGVLEITTMMEILRRYQSAQRLVEQEHDRARRAIDKLSRVG